MFFVLLTVSGLMMFSIGISNIDAAENIPPFKIDFSDKIFSRLDSPGKTLLSDYAEAYPRIKLFYRNIRLDVTEKLYRDVQGTAFSNDRATNLVREIQYEVRYNDEMDSIGFIKAGTLGPRYGRVDTQILFQQSLGIPEIDKVVEPRNEHRSHPRLVELYSPTICYELSKNNVDNKYYSLNKKRKSESYDYRVLYFDNAPYAIYGCNLEHILLSSELLGKNRKTPFYIDYAKSVNKQGQDMVEIKSFVDNGEKEGEFNPFNIYTLFKDTFVVDNIYSYYESQKKHHWYRMNCTYSGKKDGIPLLKSAEMARGVFEDNDPVKKELTIERTVWAITKIIHGPVPLSEFDVTQFLPPKTKEIDLEPARISIGRLACIVIGILLMLSAISYRIYRNRR